MQRRSRCAGFTLIESIAVIVILSIIATTAALLIGQMATMYRDRAVQGQLHVEASVALDRLMREIRAIENTDDEGTTIPNITGASTTEIQWGAGKLIDVDSGNLRLNADGTNTDILATDVSAIAFNYFDDTHTSLLSGSSVPSDDLGSIRRVSVSLTLSRYGETETLHTLVFLRSMMITSES
jgi:prepilin-type N-terminal cleavage/methylation domain-containing protein